MEALYPPTEKIRTFIVENFPALGKVSALRFVEWVQENPGGTISLPTGKTPEHFIKWVRYLLDGWSKREVIQILEEYELDPAKKPDMASLHFVQIDEFYPINSWQHNSFFYYVSHFYINGFGLDPEKALLINPNAIGIAAGESLDGIWPDHIVDLSLRTHPARNVQEQRQKKVLAAVDQFCTDYEDRIRSFGGIGFFLGGIGPDGHIGFNVQGSDHFSTTRLTETNYETQAAAATDLGGIEVSRNRHVITIGLQTITFSEDTTAIIIAAGEAKAKIVKKAIESDEGNDVPTSALQKLKNAAFYLTEGAAKHLQERRHVVLERKGKLSEFDKLQLVTDLALQENKMIRNLTAKDFSRIRSGHLLLEQINGDFRKTLAQFEGQYQKRILRALEPVKDQTFLHTAPHHDDIMLAYLPYLVRLMREQSNTHFFNYLTSGFTAVTNTFMVNQLLNASEFLSSDVYKSLNEKEYFDASNTVFRNRDVYQYLDGLAANDHFAMKEGQARRFLRNLNENYKDQTAEQFEKRLTSLREYFAIQYPGKKDDPEIQRLKGMTREWEADVLWGYFGFNGDSVIHSRLGFYKGDIFTEEPEIDRDVLPIIETLRKVKPTIVSVAFDPEGSGPDTHYKVLQAISTALRIYREEAGHSNIKIWGYRNVWYRFHPAEATLFVPVTFNGMAILNDTFRNSFVSQATASFPSYEYDGPFSGLAEQIQVQQYQYMKIALGRDFFYRNEDSRIRSTRGLVYLKIMELDEFFEKSLELRRTTENM
jgi:glucosamine-6-phosphate deaminase